MILVWIAVVLLAFWFGFELGRKWHEGAEEAELEEAVARSDRPGVKLNTIVIRR